MFAQQPLRYEGDDVAVDVPVGEFDEVEPEPLGLGLGQVGVGDEPQSEQDPAEILPGLIFLHVERQAHLLLAHLALVDEDVRNLDYAGAGPLAVGNLGILATTAPELDLPTCCLGTHLSILLKRSARDRLSSSTLPIIEYAGGRPIRLYAIRTILLACSRRSLVSTAAVPPSQHFSLSALGIGNRTEASGC